MLLAGFSFGAWVGLRVGCEHPRVSHLIGLGLPVNSTDFSFLRPCNKPKLFVHGSNDAHGTVENINTLIRTVSRDNRLIELDVVDHYVAGKPGQLDRAVTDRLT